MNHAINPGSPDDKRRTANSFSLFSRMDDYRPSITERNAEYITVNQTRYQRLDEPPPWLDEPPPADPPPWVTEQLLMEPTVNAPLPEPPQWLNQPPSISHERSVSAKL